MSGTVGWKRVPIDLSNRAPFQFAHESFESKAIAPLEIEKTCTQAEIAIVVDGS